MTNKTTNKFSAEVRARAVRMVLEHEGEHTSRWAAIVSIAGKIGCVPQTLNEWVKKVEVDSDQETQAENSNSEQSSSWGAEHRYIGRVPWPFYLAEHALSAGIDDLHQVSVLLPRFAIRWMTRVSVVSGCLAAQVSWRFGPSRLRWGNPPVT